MPYTPAAPRARPFETSFATKAVHGGNGVDAETGAIRHPIVMAITSLPRGVEAPGPG